MSDTRRPFPCNRCMQCCKRVNLLLQTAGMDRGDGVCRHLDEVEGGCRIYASRPDICRIDRQYELIYQRTMTWEAFVDVNVAACKQLQTI
ncbi:YkgJ family cysteine cluster protein [Pseudomonas sp. IT-P12]|uniref:YkgJ family cysteine cluster protein n=1 Tax=Pseudomonas sp. IT-P12 TaxID=3026450 RepID=UPI0039E0C633